MASNARKPGRSLHHTEKSASTKAEDVMEQDISFVKRLIAKSNNDWILNLASVIAFNLLMAMLPIAILLIALLGVFLQKPAIESIVITDIEKLFPGLTAQQNTITLAIQSLKGGSALLLSVAILLSLYLGSRLFIATAESFAIIYRLHTRPFIRQNLIAIGMLVLFVLLIPILVLASTVPVLTVSLLSKTFLSAIPGSGITVRIAGILGSLIASFILFEAIYFFLPNQHVTFHYSWPGAVVAAIGVVIYLQIFPLYTRYFTFGISGPVGFTIILLLFFYFFSIILLVGAEINAMLEHVQPIPKYLPNFIASLPDRVKKSPENT